MSRGHSQEGSWLALGLAAKEIGASSKVTLGQVGRDRVRKEGKGLLRGS